MLAPAQPGAGLREAIVEELGRPAKLTEVVLEYLGNAARVTPTRLRAALRRWGVKDRKRKARRSP